MNVGRPVFCPLPVGYNIHRKNLIHHHRAIPCVGFMVFANSHSFQQRYLSNFAAGGKSCKKLWIPTYQPGGKGGGGTESSFFTRQQITLMTSKKKVWREWRLRLFWLDGFFLGEGWSGRRWKSCGGVDGGGDVWLVVKVVVVAIKRK